jgi:hypothetical protein
MVSLLVWGGNALNFVWSGFARANDSDNLLRHSVARGAVKHWHVVRDCRLGCLPVAHWHPWISVAAEFGARHFGLGMAAMSNVCYQWTGLFDAQNGAGIAQNIKN